MKIYVGHVRDFDYQTNLYKPLRNSQLNKLVDIILPHEDSDKPFNSREELKTVDYMVAEVSYPSLGLGIELGWANFYNVQIIALYKTGLKLSSSVRSIAQQIVEYSSPEDMVEKLENILLGD